MLSSLLQVEFNLVGTAYRMGNMSCVLSLVDGLNSNNEFDAKLNSFIDLIKSLSKLKLRVR